MTRLECLQEYPDLFAHLLGVGSVALLGHVHYSDDDPAEDFVLDLPPGVEGFSEEFGEDEPIKYVDLRLHAAFTHQTLAKVQEAGFTFVQCDPDHTGQVVATLLVPGEVLPAVMFRL